MAKNLTIKLHGPFAALGPDGTPVPGLSRRGQALLAILGFRAGLQANRTDLCALLWGDRAEDQARASLRQELSQLRRALPADTLLADRSTVTLAATIAPPDAGAELLAGFDLPIDSFETWLREARTEDTATRVTAHLACAKADPARAYGEADAALHLDPVNEAAMQTLLRAATASGNRTAALTAYERFVETLASEIGAEPDPETASMADSLRTAPTAPPVTAKRSQPSLAVLPFEDLSGAQDFFADGVVEEITSALSHVHDFHVIARQSAFALKGAGLDIPAAAAKLGADYIVEGSVRRAGERVRIAVQLVSGSDGRTLWSERFDDRLDDLFDLQDRIAAQVAGQISPNLRTAEIARARTRPPEDRTAYELTLTALPHFWAHRREDNLKAIETLDRAIACDPGYPLAIALKAWCHAHECAYLWSEHPADDRRAAVETANHAAVLAADHAPTLVAIGAAISLTSLERERAESFIDRALRLDPNNAWGWLRKGWLNSLNNFPEQALTHFARAEALSPLDPFRFNMEFGKAFSLADLGQFEEAIALVKSGLNMAPGVTWAYRMLAAYHANLGQEAEARRAIQTFLKHYPGMTIRKMRDSMPPSILETQKAYLEGMRKAGVPEE